MSRVIIATLLLLITLFFSIFGSMFADSKGEIFENEINILKEKIAAHDTSCIESSYQIIKKWKKTHEALSLYMSHDRIGVLDETLSQIPSYLEFGNFADAISLCDKFSRQLSDLIKNEKVTLGNIL